MADPGALGFSAATHDERQGGVAASAGGIFAGAPQQAPSPGSQCRSPQLLRFAAHLALVLAAQCPYLTRSDGTQEAIEDVVCAYAEHLGKTQQVRVSLCMSRFMAGWVSREMGYVFFFMIEIAE